jgi:WD40 repeat protein
VLALKGDTGPVSAMAFSPDASAGEDNTVEVWDEYAGKQELTLQGHTNCLSRVPFSPDRRQLASASGNHTCSSFQRRNAGGVGWPVQGVETAQIDLTIFNTVK